MRTGQLSKAEYRALDHEGQLVGSDPGATHDAQSALQYDEADQAADILTRADKNGDGVRANRAAANPRATENRNFW